MSEFDLEACLERVRKQDEEAARQLIDHLYALVHKIVRSHLPKTAEEEDLCQMIFVKIFQNLAQYSNKAPFEHWVSRIAVNTCYKQLRREKARPELRYADLTEEQCRVVENLNASAEELPSDADSRDFLDRLLECLAPAERLLIQLMHIEGKPVREISALTGWSVTLVKVRAFRARQKLKKRLAALASKENIWNPSKINCVAY